MAAPRLFDRVKETLTTEGTGAYTVGSNPATGFRAVSSVAADGDRLYYVVEDGAGGWEEGIGTYTASGTSLARTTIVASSNSNLAVNWGSGTKTLAVTMIASRVELSRMLHNLTATTDPTVNDDTADGYAPGSIWLNVTDRRMYVCMVDTAAAAVWKEMQSSPQLQVFFSTSTPASLSGGATIAVGPGATASNTDAVAVGRSATASGADAIAVGDGATAASARGVSIGVSATSGQEAVAVGDAASAAATTAVAIGNAANASAVEAIAIGDAAAASQVGAIAIGDAATASTGVGAVAIGDGASAAQTGATAVGVSTSCSGANSIALGQSNVTGASAVGIGPTSSASQTGTVSIGSAAVASGSNATAVGVNTDATAAEATALGSGAQATDAESIAIGYLASASTDRSIGIGSSTNARQNDSICIGEGASVGASAGERGVAIGKDAAANAYGAVALGENAVVSVPGAVGRMFTDGSNKRFILPIQYTQGLRTTDATPTRLAFYFDEATYGRMFVGDENAFTFRAQLVALTDGGAAADAKSWEITGLVRGRLAGPVLVGNTVTALYNDAGLAAATVAVTADAVEYSLDFTVTGIAATNILWGLNVVGTYLEHYP